MRHSLIALSLAFLAACSGGAAPAAKSEPAPAPKPAPAPAAMAAPAPKPAPAPAAPAKPVTVDLSKHKAPAQNAELFGFNDGEGKVFYYTAGVVEFGAKVEADGAYVVAVKASCDEAMGQKAKFKLWIDGQQVGAETTLTAVEEKEYSIPATLTAGDRKIGLEFTNDLYKENEYDLNFYVHGVTVKPAK